MQRGTWLALATVLVCTAVVLGLLVWTAPARATITFQETGLPGGTPWSVAVDNASTSSSSGALVLQLLPGSYGFRVSSANPSGFVPYPPSGRLRVGHDDQTVRINFVRSSANVTIEEFGLPPGTDWSVAEGSTLHTTNTSSLTILEEDGLHTFRISSVSLTHTTNVGPVWIDEDAYLMNVSRIPLMVNGSDLSVSIRFDLAIHMNWTLFAVSVFPDNTSLGSPAYDYIAFTFYRYTAVNVSFQGFIVGGVTQNLTAYLMTPAQMQTFQATANASQYVLTTGNVSGGELNLTFDRGTWFVVLTGWSLDEYRSASLRCVFSFPDSSVSLA